MAPAGSLRPSNMLKLSSPTSTSGYFQKCHSTWSWPRPPFIGSIPSDDIGVLVMATICFSQKANRATHIGTPTPTRRGFLACIADLIESRFEGGIVRRDLYDLWLARTSARPERRRARGSESPVAD